MYMHSSKLFILICAILFTACRDFPKDTHGTLKRIVNDTIYAGYSDNKYVHTDTLMINNFAKECRAEVKWTRGDQYFLARLIEHKQLDLAIGGFTKRSPFEKYVAYSRPYVARKVALSARTQHTEKYVVAVKKGENAFLIRLEKFMNEYGQEK